MIIQHNIPAINSYRQLSGNNSALAKNLEKLSSGYKVNRAGDDAAGLAISEKMRAQIKGLETASKNAADGISVIQTAEGALTETHSMLNRMVELATQSANGIYGDEERLNIQAEMDSLIDEVDRIANFTNFNGQLLLTTTASSAATSDGLIAVTGAKMQLQVGDTAGQTIAIDIVNMDSANIGAVTTPGAAGYAKLSDLKSAGTGLIAGAKLKDVATANESIAVVKKAISDVSTQRASFGALQNRLEHTINNLGVTTENITAAESRIRDTDMAKEMMAYTKNNILVQASQAMLAQANQVPQGVLQLLR